MTNEAAKELSRLRWEGRSKEERSAHGRHMAQCRWGTKPHVPRAKGAVLKKPLTRAGEIPDSWLSGFMRRQMEKTGCSAREARELGIRYWDED